MTVSSSVGASGGCACVQHCRCTIQRRLWASVGCLQAFSLRRSTDRADAGLLRAGRLSRALRNVEMMRSHQFVTLGGTTFLVATRSLPQSLQLGQMLQAALQRAAKLGGPSTLPLSSFLLPSKSHPSSLTPIRCAHQAPRRPGDLYRVVGCPPTATAAELKSAFRKRAKQLHPDAASALASKEAFAELLAAYQVLSQPRSRQLYDLSDGSGPSILRAAAAGGVPGAASQEDDLEVILQLRLFPIPLPAASVVAASKSACPPSQPPPLSHMSQQVDLSWGLGGIFKKPASSGAPSALEQVRQNLQGWVSACICCGCLTCGRP